MSVTLDWLTQIDVVINTTAIQVPTFNNCMIMAVFPTADRPDGSVGYATNWGTSIFHEYSNSADIVKDFTVNYNAAITATQFAQAFKYQILMKQALEFFAQVPTPQNLYVSCLDNTTTIDYTAQFSLITAAQNNFYAFTIADQITATQLTTPITGIYDALSSLTSAKNLKIMFVDTSNMAITSGNFLFDATIGGIGNQRAMLCAHSKNPQTAVPGLLVTGPQVTLGAAFMGAFFTNLFSAGIGLKAMSGQVLQSTLSDPVVTNSTIGIPGQGDGLLGVNANIYPSFGTSAQGYMQYGFTASTTTSQINYLDEIIGADYIKLNVQADLTTYLLSQQPTGGVPYTDVGIQNLVSVFKNTLQGAVTQNIIQQFTNSNITAVNYANTPLIDKTNRIYKGLSANLTYLQRIQRLQVGITLGL